MADKKIKVKVDVETDVEPSLASLRALKKQLRETAAGSEEFIALQRKIDDIQDSLAGARAGAGNFADVLGALPGPIGAIGGQLSGTVTTLKQFSGVQFTNIQASFAELGADITDIVKGLFDLTGITKVYTVLNNALARSFVAVGVGETAAAAGAKAFAAALTATGIGALVVGLGLLIANWDKVVDAIKGATAESKTYEEAQSKVTEGLTDFNKKLIDVENSFAAAKAGTISKKDALKLYNDTLGKTVGFAGSLEQAEQLLADNTAVVIEGIKLRTQANVFYAKSAEAAAKAVSGEDVDPSVWQTVGDFLLSGGQYAQFATRQVGSYAKNLKEVQDNAKLFEKEGDELTRKAIENDKKLKKGLASPPDYEASTKAANDALAEINKAFAEARLVLLGEQEKELEQVRIKYDDLVAKAKKYGKDTKLLEEARAKENTAIREKFAKEEKDKLDKATKEALDVKKKDIDDSLALEEQYLNLRFTKGEISETEFQNKLFEIRKNAAVKNELLTNENLAKDDTALQAALSKNKEYIAAEIELEKFKVEQKKLTAEEERGILLTSMQSRLEALDVENQRLEFDFEQDLQRLAEQRQILTDQEAIELQNTELTEFQKTEIRKKYADARKGITDQEIATEKAAAAAKHEINMAYLGLFEQFGNLLGQIAGKNKALAIAGIIISQAASIGQIIANTAIANAKSVAASPLTFGQPWVAINTISAGLSIASSIAAAAKSIQQINSQPGPSAPNAGSAAGSAASVPRPPAVAGAAAPQINTAGGQNPTAQIGETIAASQKPIKAFVVSGDVSSQQALDRRTSRAATFSGG